MEQNDIAQRGANISKAIDIISNGLKSSLNMETEGDLAERLSALYEYIIKRLLWLIPVIVGVITIVFAITVLMPGATDTEIFERGDMLDTKVASSQKDDPAKVAQGAEIDAFVAGSRPVTDADAAPSPAPSATLFER